MIFENGDSVQTQGFGIWDSLRRIRDSLRRFLVQRIRQQDFLRILGIRWGEKLRNCPKSTYICFLFEFWTLVGWYSLVLFDWTVKFCTRRCVASMFDLRGYNTNRCYSLCRLGDSISWNAVRIVYCQLYDWVIVCSTIIDCPLCRVGDSVQRFVVRIVDYPLCRVEFDLIDCSTNRLLSAVQSGRFDLIDWIIIRCENGFDMKRTQLLRFVNSD